MLREQHLPNLFGKFELYNNFFIFVSRQFGLDFATICNLQDISDFRIIQEEKRFAIVEFVETIKEPVVYTFRFNGPKVHSQIDTLLQWWTGFKKKIN